MWRSKHFRCLTDLLLSIWRKFAWMYCCYFWSEHLSCLLGRTMLPLRGGMIHAGSAGSLGSMSYATGWKQLTTMKNMWKNWSPDPTLFFHKFFTILALFRLYATYKQTPRDGAGLRILAILKCSSMFFRNPNYRSYPMLSNAIQHLAWPGFPSWKMVSACEARFKCCFVSMSRVRMSLLLVMLAVRAALAALLGFCGALWLCRTRDVENIIQKLSTRG